MNSIFSINNRLFLLDNKNSSLVSIQCFSYNYTWLSEMYQCKHEFYCIFCIKWFLFSHYSAHPTCSAVTLPTIKSFQLLQSLPFHALQLKSWIQKEKENISPDNHIYLPYFPRPPAGGKLSAENKWHACFLHLRYLLLRRNCLTASLLIFFSVPSLPAKP